jgi:hypothetical protein
VIKVDADRLFWQSATSLVTYSGLRWKALFSAKAGRSRARFNSDDAFEIAAWFLEAVGEAAGHYARLLCQALCTRTLIGHHQVAYLRAQYGEYITASLDQSIVRKWLEAALTESSPRTVPNAAKFDQRIRLVYDQISKAGKILPTILADHHLMIAIAVFGHLRADFNRDSLPRPLPENAWRSQSSFFMKEAEKLLRYSARHIRRLIKSGELNMNEKKRIVNDEQFDLQYRKRNPPK